jgi:hypothetical protein
MTTKKESKKVVKKTTKKQAKKTQPKKVGRPTDYTPELGDLICAGIAEAKSLVKICKDESLPSARTVYTWLRTNPEFLQNYANAKEDQADYMVEEMLEIADDGRNDYMENMDDQGGVAYKLNGEHVTRSRLRVDTRKWAASKFKAKKYGDRIINENKDISSFQDMTEDELQRKKQELERELENSKRD